MPQLGQVELLGAVVAELLTDADLLALVEQADLADQEIVLAQLQLGAKALALDPAVKASESSPLCTTRTFGASGACSSNNRPTACDTTMMRAAPAKL